MSQVQSGSGAVLRRWHVSTSMRMLEDSLLVAASLGSHGSGAPPTHINASPIVSTLCRLCCEHARWEHLLS